MRKNYPLILGILFLFCSTILRAQDYNVTMPQQCSPNTGGTETVTFPGTPVSASGDATLSITYRGDLDIAGTEFLTFFDEDGNTLGISNNVAQCTGIDSFVTTLAMADIMNWAADGQIEVVAQASPGVNNNLTGCISLSSFCVEMRLYYPVTTAPNDIGVASLDTPGAFFCSGNYDLWVTVQNYGTNQVANHTVNWTWNGNPETPVSVSTPLDTVNGTGPYTLSVQLGNKMVTGTNTLVAWTSNPNGIADTITANDTLTLTLVPSIQAPTNLGIANATPTAVDLTWTEVGSATSWALEFGTSGFTQGTGTDLLANSNPYNLTGLTQNSLYDYYVRSICSGGDSSAWSGPFTFKTPCVPSVTAFPYSANFDGPTTDWISQGSNTSWALGTPSNAIINAPASAPNSWVTNLTGTYSANEDGWVEGPCIAFDTLIAPEVSVDVWWNSEFSWDGMQMQYSTDAGGTWNKVSSFGDPTSTNWYTDNTVDGLLAAINDGDGWTGRASSSNGSGGWLTATADLTPLAGNASVKFRMVFGSDGSVQDEGVGFDNFIITETALPFNLELVEIISPNSGCGLSSTEAVTIEYANVGINPILTGTNIDFRYYLNGTPVNESITLSADFLPGDTSQYTFTLPADLSVPNTYSFGAVVDFAGDQNSLNDSLGKSIVSIPVISSYPYYEDFENGPGGWTSGGANSSWEFGTPAQAVINGASSGDSAWATSLTSNYNTNEQSFVLGPCFDFTNLVLPLIKIDVNWNSEFSWDGMQVQASTDAGATWNVVGNQFDPFNWYNDGTINGLVWAPNEEGWTGRTTSGNGSNGWLTAENDLTSFAGNSGVLMRVVFGSDGSVQDEGVAFDNFHILESPNNDIAVDSLVGLSTGCGYTDSTTIQMRITNRGILPQNNVPVFYTVNGVASPTETITSTINPGSTLLYTFNNVADLSTPQSYTIIGYAALATDEDTTNDVSQSNTFTALFTPEVLSVTDGETCESGPVTLSMTSNGDTDQWFDSQFGGTPVGTGSTFTIPNVIEDTTLWVQTVMNGTGCSSAAASGRIPVRAFHSTTPVINFTFASVGNLAMEFTSSLSSNVDSVLWDFGDGSTDSDPNPTHTFPASSSYLVNLTAYAGSCSQDTSKAVFVPVGGVTGNNITGLSVFPNPSEGIFRVSADGITGKVTLKVISITGNEVFNQEIESLDGKIEYDVILKDVSSGSYLLKIQNETTLINGRIVVE